MAEDAPSCDRHYGAHGIIRGFSMLEHVVPQMGPMLIIAGLAAGWLSEAVARRRGYGLLRDMALGIIGSLIAGAATSQFVSDELGMVGMFVVGLIGAAVVIAAQRNVWPARRSAT